MIDANSQFFAILTNVGMAKQANADALGIPWKITEMGVGDANNTDPIPSAAQTRLINEWRRRPLNQLKVDPVNPAVIIAEQVIPADEGGHWIRELGLYDADGDLVAVANCAPSFKPVLSQGSGRTQIVRMNFIVASSGNITLKIDPAVVLATRSYVDAVITEVLPANKVPGTYTKVTINERGIVQSGSNPTTLGDYGITDALSKSGGDVTGNLRMIDSRSVEIVASGTSSWAGGVNAMKTPAGGGTMLGSFGVWGSNNSLNCLYMALGATPWGSGNGVRVSASGVTVEGILSGNGSGLTAVPFASLTSLPNTLSGHGVTLASQAEAEAGADTNKPMTALRVFQAIMAKVVQATGSVAGIARIASQVEVNSGTDDTTFITPKKFFAGVGALIVQASENIAGIARVATQAQTDAGTDDTCVITPKKLRWGFHILKAQQGYVVFPSWLGGFVIQWGYAWIPNAATVVPFSLSHPNACFAVVPMVVNSSVAADVVELTGAPTKDSFMPVIVSSGASGSPTQVAGAFFWLSIGH
ncbi:phage tail protein [Pseudomonas sp. S2_B07]